MDISGPTKQTTNQRRIDEVGKRVEYTCDRCGGSLKAYPRIRLKRVMRVRYEKMFNGHDPYAYINHDEVYCPDCVKSFEAWRKAKEVSP